jgi:hypothetical protein
MISQLLSSQAAANFCASGSDFSPVGSLPTSPRARGRKFANFLYPVDVETTLTRVFDVFGPL